MNAPSWTSVLDPDQLEVVTRFGQPLAVIAGAGSGKTRTLAYRIAHGIETGHYHAERILALSFTTKAATELGQRLAGLGVSGVACRTIHSAALAQLGNFWPQLAGGPAPAVLESKGSVIAEAAKSVGLVLDIGTLRDVAAEIEWRKVRMLSLDGYAEELSLGRRRAPGRLPAEPLVELMRRYQGLLERRRQIDFEDVLLLGAGMLSAEPRILAEVQARYQHLLIDEFQDISPVQFELVRLWAGDRADLCVVGDPSQTIFSFAGARSAYLEAFDDYFPGALTLTLRRNYRSTPAIVDAANSLMRSHGPALELLAVRQDSGPPPGLWQAADDDDEVAHVVTEVQRRIESGTRADEIAILVRSHAQAAPVHLALRKAGVPVTIDRRANFFDRPEVRTALQYLQAEALSGGVRPLVQTVTAVVRSLGWRSEPPEAPGDARERWEALDALASLAESRPDTGVSEFLSDIRKAADAGVEPGQGAVALFTIHAAKGLEWPIVYLIGAVEGVLPYGSRPSLEQVAEERRLMYVAITRAKEELVVVGSARSLRANREPSRFVRESGIGNLDVRAPRRAGADPRSK